MKIELNDPRLTAYALGELDEHEAREVEALIRDDAEAQAQVNAIRDLATSLTETLNELPPLSLTEAQQHTIETQATRRENESKRSRKRRWFGLEIPLLPLASLASGVVALIFVFMLWLNQDRAFVEEPGEPQTVRFVESVKTEPHSSEFAPSPQTPKEAEALAPVASTPLQAEARREFSKDDALGSLGVIGHGGGGGGGVGYGRGAARISGRAEGHGTLELRKRAAAPLRSGDMYMGLQPSSPPSDFNTETYDYQADNPFKLVNADPLSTFSIDVDTASYANVRRFLRRGQLPPKDAVRIEELINYFDYRYPSPTEEHPFSVAVDVTRAPWNRTHYLARIGLKGKEVALAKRPPINLVFLLDVSGSMDTPEKLPLVAASMKLLLRSMTERDRVAIAVYAGASGLVLPSTPCDERGKNTILESLERLRSGGSTNGGDGIHLAYRVAQNHFIREGVNRIVLATDGDFNIGVTNQGDLVRLVEEKAKSGVFLSVLGFGMGNYKDATLEKLADKGNGNYAYIDTLAEAQKVLANQVGSTLITIAKDVKIQVEFNPQVVSAYRLIGYENRVLQAQDFNDDKKDAGEIGAGHTVTALYELVPRGIALPDAPVIDRLKYQNTPSESIVSSTESATELMTVKLRYKKPHEATSIKLEIPIRHEIQELLATSRDLRFVSAVAAFGMILRDSPYKGSATLDMAEALAKEGIGDDLHGYRREFIALISAAKRLKQDGG